MERHYKILSFSISLFIPFMLFLGSNCFAQSNLRNKAIELYDSSWVYFNNGKSKDALNSLTKTIEIKKHFPYDSLPEYFKVYNRLGIMNMQLGDLSLAFSYYTKALNYTSGKYNQEIIQSNIANVYLLKGDYVKAITIYENSLITLKESNKRDKYFRIVDNHNNQGLAYFRMRKYEQAKQKYLQALIIAKQHNIEDIHYINMNCAQAYERLNSLNLAEKHYKKELSFATKEYGNKHIETSMSELYLAYFYAKTKEFKKASSLFEKVYASLTTTLDREHPYFAEYYKYVGDMYFGMGDKVQALTNYQQALISKIPAFNDSAVYSNPNTNALPDIFLLEILKSKAEALEKISEKENREANLIAALQTLELATEFIEQLREGYLYETSKLELAEKEHNTYMSIIRICHTLMELTGNTEYAHLAFRYSEKSKYAVLRETINEEMARGVASVPDSVTDKEKRIKEQLGHIRRQIAEEQKQLNVNTTRINKLKQQLFSLSQKREAIVTKLEQDYPKYYKRKYNNRVAGINELQKILSGKEAIIGYELNNSLLYTFVITNNTLEFICTPADTVFYFYLKEYKDYLHSDEYLGYTKFRKSSFVMYNKLINPVKHSIVGKNLLIIPDSEISTIAFEAFTTEPYVEKEFADFATEPYLIRKHPIGYSYSATLYFNSINKKPKTNRKFLGFAPDYDNSRDSLQHLPLVPDILRKNTRKFKRKLFTHEEATEYNFKKHVKDYGIIHFYAHGSDDNENPALSRIYLSYKNDTVEDGYLYAYEVSELEMNTELVVLASCNSGTGAITKSEGALSIGRSFMNSNNSSIVLSLWAADVYTSIKIIEEFYKQLFLGKRKDEAMWLAKLKFLETAEFPHADPQYWNSLVIIGNQDALFHRYWLKRVFLVIFIITTIFFIIKLVRKRM